MRSIFLHAFRRIARDLSERALHEKGGRQNAKLFLHAFRRIARDLSERALHEKGGRQNAKLFCMPSDESPAT